MTDQAARPEGSDSSDQLGRSWASEPEPRTVDCCGVVDEHDIVECSRCGRQWTVPCSFDEDYS